MLPRRAIQLRSNHGYADAGRLSVSIGDYEATGEAGGPFSPASRVYYLRNSSNSIINWTAAKTAAWIDLSTASGSLAPNETTNLTVSVNATANGLSEGAYGDTVTFSTNDENIPGTTTRSVSLTVGAAVGGALAIATWAYPDSATVTGSINVGVAAYHAGGISRVDFAVDGGATTPVSSESLNAATGEYEYVYQIDTTGLTDTSHTISATAVPSAGTSFDLPPLIIQVANALTFAAWYVDDTLGNDTTGNGSSGAPYKTMNKACQIADSGDTIKVRSGSYALPSNTGYAFTKYVTIQPDTAASVTIAGAGSLRSSFLKFSGVTFTVSSAAQSVINSNSHHFWFDNCTFIGYGKNEPTNNASAIRSYYSAGWQADAGKYLTVENCTIHDFSVGVTCTAGYFLLRNNTIYDQTADGFDWDGANGLISHNTVHDNHLPPGGDQHCDFWASNVSGTQVIIRNNLGYNGDHQGNKFGGYNDGRDQPYTNIAFVNNVMALGTNGSVNLRLEGTAKGKRFDNVLIEHNTIWHGTSSFVVEADVNAADVIVRNNAFVGSGTIWNGAIAGITHDHNFSSASDTEAKFTDYANWDFTLQSDSPLKAAGIPVSVGRDLDWHSRSGVSPSEGAYE